MSLPLQEFSPSQLNKKRQASIFDFASTKKRRQEYPLSPPTSSPVKKNDDYNSAEFQALEKSPVPLDLSSCAPAHLRSGINSISHTTSRLSRLQWREMDGLSRKHILTHSLMPHKYSGGRGLAVAIEDCPLPVLCGASSRTTQGFWIGCQDGSVLNINSQLEHVDALKMHNNAILDMSRGAGMPDHLATASGDKSVILWDTAQNQDVPIRQYFCGNGGSIRKLASHDSAQMLAAGSRSGTVVIIDPRSKDPIKNMHCNAHFTMYPKGPRLTKQEKANKPGITAIDWLTETTLATGAGHDSEVRIWDLRYLNFDGPTGVLNVEGKAHKPLAVYKSEETGGVTDLHYDLNSKILYSIGHRSVVGYACNYGAHSGMRTVLSYDNDEYLPPMLYTPLNKRTFYSGSAITDGYLAVGEGRDTVNVLALPDSFADIHKGMKSRRINIDTSGSTSNVQGHMEVATLNWVDGLLMGCTDTGVVFRIDTGVLRGTRP